MFNNRRKSLQAAQAKRAAMPKADASTNARNLAQAQKANAGTQKAFFGTNPQRMREQQVAAQKAAQGANRFTAQQGQQLKMSNAELEKKLKAGTNTPVKKATVLSRSKGPNPKATAQEMQAAKVLQARAQAKPGAMQTAQAKRAAMPKATPKGRSLFNRLRARRAKV